MNLDQRATAIWQKMGQTCNVLCFQANKVKKIHSFKQSRLSSEYIILNAKLRKEDKNDFENDSFKLMKNSCMHVPNAC
jgi:hypothetical protein